MPEERPANLDGPGRDRTCDLGIKSPARQAATNCTELKRAANRDNDCCNKLQRNAACGDKPVRTIYAQFVDVFDNEPSSSCASALERAIEWSEGKRPRLATLRAEALQVAPALLLGQRASDPATRDLEQELGIERPDVHERHRQSRAHRRD
jgi:hypothetical protein